MLFEGQVAVGEEPAVARVVIRLVERPQLFPGQLGNLQGFTTGVLAVAVGREQGGIEAPTEQGGGVGHGAFHFVEDDTPDRQTGQVIRVGELEPVAFLQEVLFAQQGEEGGVEVDPHQVVEVLAVHAGDRVKGPVSRRQRIHEGVQAAFEHGEKRIAYRVFFRPAEHSVLEDVGHPGRIRRRRAEAHREHIVRVIAGQVQQPRSGRLVQQGDRRQVEFPDRRKLFYQKTAKPFAGQGKFAVHQVLRFTLIVRLIVTHWKSMHSRNQK